MKTIKLIAPVLFMLFLISSCTTEEYYTEPGSDTNFFAKDIIVPASNWRLIGGENNINSYYECVVHIENLDSQYYPEFSPYYDGVITVSIYSNYQQNGEVQIPLPYTVYDAYEQRPDEWVYRSVQYSYDIHADGSIAFKKYISDYYTEDLINYTEYFKVAAVW